MRSAKTIDSAPVDSLEPAESLREVAAYLRGIADATAALSQRPARPSEESEADIETSPTSSRKTMPYAGHRKGDTMPIGHVAACPVLETIEDFVAAGREDCWDGESPSNIRLRVGVIAPEWYDALGCRAG